MIEYLVVRKVDEFLKELKQMADEYYMEECPLKSANLARQNRWKLDQIEDSIVKSINQKED